MRKRGGGIRSQVRKFLQNKNLLVAERLQTGFSLTLFFRAFVEN